MAILILIAGVVSLAFIYGEMYDTVTRPGVREIDHPPDLTEAVLRHELSYRTRHHRSVPKHLAHLAVESDDSPEAVAL